MKKFLIFTLILCTFFSTLILTQPKVNATENVPSVEDIWDKDTYPYAVITLTSATNKYFCTFMTGEIEDHDYDGFKNKGAYQTYALNSSNEWILQGSYGSGQSKIYYDNVVYSSFDLFDDTGTQQLFADTDFFFPAPLHQIVGEVGATSVKSQWSQILGGTIPILMACGVGCLALLILLKLFGKKSLIFRR